MFFSHPASPQQGVVTDQALIPDKVKKSLQSRVLMDFYEQKKFRKLQEDRMKYQEKHRQLQFSERQKEQHIYQTQLRRHQRENSKQEYARQYDQMIEQRKERQKYERQLKIQSERKLLGEASWLRGIVQQKQIQKQKRIQYGQQLDRSLKMQEQRRTEEATKMKQQREKFKYEIGECNPRQPDSLIKARVKNINDYKRNQIGVKDTLNWSQIPNDSLSNQPRPLTPRMQRMLKLQQTKYYDKGVKAPYKSQQHRQYFEKNNPEDILANSRSTKETYNTITNPIQNIYKNPYVLKIYSNFS